MNAFLQRHESSVIGMLSGFDRLLFRGTLRFLATAKGLMGYLWSVKTLLKDFGEWSLQLTEQVKRESLQVATDAGRPVVYVIDPSARKEELALEIARRDKIDRGLVCVLTAVEPCCSYDIHRNRQKRKLELVARRRKCLHLYHYQVHPQFGLMHARLQTWLPFNVKVCLNGRQWLGRQMDRAGIDYVKRENCFTRVSDLPAAQTLLDAQLTADWPGLLDAVRRSVHPAHDRAFAANPLDYYWSVDQSEWASDVLFKDRASLAGLYPRLINQGMATLGSRDVMRFLGRRVPAHGGINGNFDGQVITTLKERPEGIRLKHQVKHNSVKMYDKQGSVLRVETTLNDTRDFKVYRTVEGKPKGKPKYRQLRKGVADLHRRAELSQACNDRYLQAMAAVETTQTLGELTRPLCRATTWNGQRVRPLHPLGGADADLLQAISGGEFLVNGFRNRDLREQLFGGSKPSTNDKAARRQQSGVVTRKLRLLRAHGLVRKVPRTHRYLLTETGQLVVTALQAAKAANPTELRKIAA